MLQQQATDCEADCEELRLRLARLDEAYVICEADAAARRFGAEQELQEREGMWQRKWGSLHAQATHAVTKLTEVEQELEREQHEERKWKHQEEATQVLHHVQSGSMCIGR